MKRIPIKERFEAKYIPEPMSGCWLWEAGVNACGYGTIGVGGRSVLAHRLSYELYVGVVPEGKNVLHRCDVPCCVNPEHLFPGTQRDNIHDMENKKRSYHPAGAAHGRAKLTNENVANIRIDFRSSRIIAKTYGVSKFVILRIKNGSGWKNNPC